MSRRAESSAPLSDTAWSDEAVRILRCLQPGSRPEVLDQRRTSVDEAWVTLRAGTGQCVLGLRCAPGDGGVATHLLYLHGDVPVGAVTAGTGR